MSRARNIKPGFFKNDLLVELPFEYRLLFVGLWTMADRAGRLEDRPTKIRMELFPADAVNVDAGLQALHDAGFVQRYEAEGKRLVQVVEFAKHQNPHKKEAASTLPAPCKPGASPVQATTEAIASPADSLIPDSLIPDSKEERASPNGSRLPADFVMPDEWLAWARAERPDVDVDREAKNFTDHWHAKAGKDARKADWLATWRKWIRSDYVKSSNPRAGPQQPQPVGKQMQGLMALEAMKSGNRMAAGRGTERAAEAVLLVAGSDARR